MRQCKGVSFVSSHYIACHHVYLELSLTFPRTNVISTRLDHRLISSGFQTQLPTSGLSYTPPAISSSSPSESKQHPYSLREFSDDTLDHELQWKLHREQLDAFNHAYWAESNIRFEAAKFSVLAALPPNAPTESTRTRLV
ncbi:hypothetical protein F4604DRAFT_390375 [Suillus subluteus]|nr:hypothetical protein F4604DRAFT_390375 [Suillus subluteus]